MWPCWDSVIAPLLDAAGSRTIVEIGAEQGRTTRMLLQRAARVGGRVEAIDPAPRLDVSRWELEHGERLRFHRARSVDALPTLAAVDAALIDGDHNWHTVHSELTLLAQEPTRWAATYADGPGLAPTPLLSISAASSASPFFQPLICCTPLIPMVVRPSSLGGLPGPAHRAVPPGRPSAPHH